MNGKIVYRFETPIYPKNILYINIIEKYCCTNNCLFCDRPRSREEIGKPNIYEKKADSFLYLPKSPPINDIMKAIDSEIKKDDREIAIVGLGEPLIYLPKVVDMVKKIKEKYHVKTRIDTNGLVKCMYRNATQRLEKAGLDEIRISLNAIDKKEYNQLCRPKFKNAFKNLTDFVTECVKSRIDTYVSFVIGFKRIGTQQRTNKDYKNFALSLGVNPKNTILRKYMKPIN